MKKICYLHTGTNMHDIHLLQIFRSMHPEYEIYLIASEEIDQNLIKEYNLLNIKIIQLNHSDNKKSIKSYFKLFTDIFKYRYYLRKIKPDLIYASELLPWGLYATLSGVNKFSKIISFSWGSDLLIYPKKNKFLKRITKYIINHSDLIVVDSIIANNELRDLMISKSKPMCQKSIIWFWNAEFLKNKSPENYPSKKIRNSLGWNDKTIIFSNRWLSDLYNVNKLVEIIPTLIQNNKDLRFLIINEGPLQNKLENFVKNNDCSDYVKFTGRLNSHEEMLNYLCASDIFISIAKSDANSTAVLEAIIMEIPCIVSDIPANRMFIEDHKNGIIIDPEDPKKLSNSILELANSRDFRLKCKQEYKYILSPIIKDKSSNQPFHNYINKIIE